MPLSCVAYGCTNVFKVGQNIHFFRFPLDNEEVNRKWIIALRRKNFTPTKWSRICSIHFTESDYQIRPNYPTPRLRIDSVPSIFPAFPSYYQKSVKPPQKEPTKRIFTPIDVPIIDADLEVEDSLVADKGVQTLENYSSEIFLKRQIKRLQQRLRRREKKIVSLQDSLKDLKCKSSIDTEPRNVMENCFSAGVLLYNHSDYDFIVNNGDRVAQLICEKIVNPEVVEFETLDETDRGADGFESTGTN